MRLLRSAKDLGVDAVAVEPKAKVDQEKLGVAYAVGASATRIINEVKDINRVFDGIT